jgi:hypothetical protein
VWGVFLHPMGNLNFYIDIGKAAFGETLMSVNTVLTLLAPFLRGSGSGRKRSNNVRSSTAFFFFFEIYMQDHVLEKRRKG